MSDTSIRKELVNLKANPEALKQMSYEDWWLNNCDERLFTPKEVESLLASAEREAVMEFADRLLELSARDIRAINELKEFTTATEVSMAYRNPMERYIEEALVKEPEGDKK